MCGKALSSSQFMSLSDLPELKCAAQWWAEQLTCSVSKEQKDVFRESLHRGIVKHCSGHWYPAEPMRGNSYRSISNSIRVDPLLIQAGTFARIPDVGRILPKAVLWVDPGKVKVQGEKPQFLVTVFPARNSSAAHASFTFFSIWVDNIIEEMKGDLETIFNHFGPLCQHAIEPIKIHGHSYSANKGAYINFVSFADAVAAIDACCRRSVAWGQHINISIYLTAKPVGNTQFILNLLETLSNQTPALPFSQAEQLHALSAPSIGGHWLDAVRQCANLFAVDEERCLVSRRAAQLPQQSLKDDQGAEAEETGSDKRRQLPSLSTPGKQAALGDASLPPCRPRCDHSWPLHSASAGAAPPILRGP